MSMLSHCARMVAVALTLNAAAFATPAVAHVRRCCAQRYRHIPRLEFGAYGFGRSYAAPAMPSSVWYYDHYNHFTSNCDTPSGAC
jgi:hypothetical protein